MNKDEGVLNTDNTNIVLPVTGWNYIRSGHIARCRITDKIKIPDLLHDQVDEILWKHCLTGDTDAFELLYRRYYPRLYGYGYKFTSDKELIRNCIQDLFVKIIADYKKLSYTESVSNYLFKAFRRRLFQLSQNKPVVFTDDFSALEQIQDIEDEPELQKENLRKMLDAYKTLSSKQRKIIYLYYLCKMGHDEIAGLLGINYQSSKNMLHRSLVKLRDRFFNQPE